MRIESVRIDGVLRFAKPASLDLATLPDGLVAIVGANGGGKTTLLEAVPATLWREFPSRAGHALTDYAHGTGALSVSFSLDGPCAGRYRATVTIDAAKRAQEAVLLRAQDDGTWLPLTDGKVTTYDAAIADLLPSRDVVLASVFAAQNRQGSFVTLDRKGRKDLFARLLGLEHYEQMAATARQKAIEIDRQILGVESKARVITEQIAAYGPVSHQMDEARRRYAEAQEALPSAIVARDAAHHEQHMAARRVAQFDVANERQRQEQQRIDELEDRLSALDRAGARLDAEAQATIASLSASEQAKTADLATRRQNNATLLAQAEAIRAAVASIAALEDERQALSRARTIMEHDKQASQQAIQRHLKALAGESAARHALARAERDAGCLASVPCRAEGAFAECQFLVDAREASTAIPTLRAAVSQFTELHSAHDREAERLAGLEHALAPVVRRMAEIESALVPLRATAKHAAALDAAEDRIAEIDAALVALETETAVAIHQVSERATTSRKQQAVERGALCQSLAGAREALAHCTLELTAQPQAMDALQRATAIAIEADDVLARMRDQSARAEGDVTRLMADEARADTLAAQQTALGAQLSGLKSDLVEWDLLATVFGREGLPVLEIDAAGPTVSTDCNALLHSCCEGRFSVDLVTQEAKAGGKGTKETFELKVLDNHRGGEARDISDLSGGEQVLVDEALKNALAIYANRRTAAPMRTLWRDETTGALDAENADRYVAMLRAVQRVGGFNQVLFVTHNPHVAAQADAQIRLSGGAIQTALPPFAVEG